eukprot:scaffold130463_cov31-Tisochrysis_lutea.AAC.7
MTEARMSSETEIDPEPSASTVSKTRRAEVRSSAPSSRIFMRVRWSSTNVGKKRSRCEVTERWKGDVSDEEEEDIAAQSVVCASDAITVTT